MKKKNFATLLGIALVVALVSTGVFYGLFVPKLRSNNDPTHTIVVAAKSLPAGTVLAATDLKTMPWATDKLPPGSFERVAEVTGQTLFDGVADSEPLLTNRLASSDGSGRSAGVPAGMRAVSVHVTDSSGVVSLLHSGHKVDVQVLIPAARAGDPAQLRTAIENLEVLAVSPKNDQSSQGNNLPVVTLLAKPEQADVLAIADSGARIRLTLRNPLDGAARSRPPVSLSAIMQAEKIAPVPVKASPVVNQAAVKQADKQGN
jgi:pilus assembly protein CpaB